jgi:hypothetical protein
MAGVFRKRVQFNLLSQCAIINDFHLREKRFGAESSKLAGEYIRESLKAKSNFIGRGERI